MRVGRRRGSGINAIERGLPGRHTRYGLVAWLYPPRATVVSGAVSSLSVQGTGGVSAVSQGTAAARPAYVAANAGFNGRPTINSDGTDDVLNGVGTLTAPAPQTVFVACLVTDGVGAVSGTIFGWTTNFNTRLRRGSNATCQLLTSSLTLSNNAVMNIKHVHTAVYNGASSSCSADGGTPATGAVTNDAWNTIDLSGVGPFQLSGMQFAEGIVFAGTVLPANVAKRIQRRLGALYGIAIV
jgi:hypothetical protein